MCSEESCGREPFARGMCRKHYNQAWRASNPERWNEYQRAYYQRYKPTKQRKARERYRANPAKAARQALARRIKREFGISLEEYETLTSQPCGLCGATENIVLDHCHRSGEVRGPLCQVCNKALGMLGDDPERLRAAANYIEQHRRL